MYHVGEQSILSRRLTDVTFECMWKGIQQVKNGATLGDIGHAIQKHAEANGFSVVREFCGHGIGQRFHEDPQVLHYGKPGTGVKLVTGMLFTIEPMINAGRREIRQLSDGWTVVTRDHSLSAQWEHAVCVTDTGYEVLTLSPGMPQPPAFITEPSSSPPSDAAATMTAAALTALRERIQESRRTAVAQFREHERPDTLLSELRRIVDAALRDLVKQHPCPRARRWRPWAAMAAASCTRIRTWIC